MKSPAIPQALAALAAALVSASVAGEARAGANFDGHWASLSCELRPQVGPQGKLQPWYLKRDIQIRGHDLDAKFTTFADGECKMPLWRLEFGATLREAGAWPQLSGAYKIDLAVDRYTRIVPLAAGFAEFLNSPGEGTCGPLKAAVDLAQDISKTGCKAFGLPPGATVKEVETMMVQNGMLFFAARPVDGSSPDSDEKRVFSLQVPLVSLK